MLLSLRKLYDWAIGGNMFTGWIRYAAMGLAALLLIAVIVGSVKSCKKIDQEQDNALVNSGEVREREASKTEVINRVEQAKDAGDNASDAERRNVCNKYDRNCQGNL
jgi:hypothetical protein